MLVVADTSALMALAACDALALLDQLFGQIRVPPAVLRECGVRSKTGADRREDSLRDRVTKVDLGDFVIAAGGQVEGHDEPAGALSRRVVIAEGTVGKTAWRAADAGLALPQISVPPI